MSDTADKWTQPTEEAETEESDGSTLDWESTDVYMHWYMICDRSIKVEIPVRAPLYGEDANEAADDKVKHIHRSDTALAVRPMDVSPL